MTPRILITGAGGFIGGHLVQHFRNTALVRAVDKKPLPEWYQMPPDVEYLQLDLGDPAACAKACKGATEVYNLACDMGGIGFIESERIACMRSVLINTHMLEAAYRAGCQRYFYSSSACVYNTTLQQSAGALALKESDAYPAMAERGYGWEKLYSEMLCQEYTAERGMHTAIGRFFNIFGPYGTWTGGREKAPAAMCRKVLEVVDAGEGEIEIWGDGRQIRNFTYIDDAIEGIDRIMHCDALKATPVNLGSSETIAIDSLADMAERIAGVKLSHKYKLDAPKGVGCRNSDNAFIQSVLGWQPRTPIGEGMANTYAWIKQQYEAKKSGAAYLV